MYNEICVNIASLGWTKVSDPSGNMGPYAYKGNQWVGYDDVDMVTRKFVRPYKIKSSRLMQQ